MRKLKWPLLCALHSKPQPLVFISLTKVSVAADMTYHVFLRHFCAVFLSTLCFISVIKFSNRVKSSEEININFTNYYDEVEKGKRQVQLGLNSLRSLKSSGKNETIYFLGLFELSTKTGERKESESEVAAAQLAVEHVNRMGVLPGYYLRLLINDTKVCGL